MHSNASIRNQVEENGFAIINDFYSEQEIDHLLSLISCADITRPAFRKTNDLFAIRQLFKEIPQLSNEIFNTNLNKFISTIFGGEYFVVKSIYFDKPENSNWFVAYHQDLTISVDKKLSIEGFGPWTTKQNLYAVQPPLGILKDNFTIRIHLDKTTKENGALKVLPKSHLNDICRPEDIRTTEINCELEKGGIMVMKPLLLHSSGRTTNKIKRRVIHIEFSRSFLPGDLKWAELVPKMFKE